MNKVAVRSDTSIGTSSVLETLVVREPECNSVFRGPNGAGGKPKRVLMWFHTDLRVEDNEALVKGVEHSKGPNGAFLPVFVVNKKTTKQAMAAAAELRTQLRALGSDLIVVRGDAAKVLPEMCRKHRIDVIYHNRSVRADAADVEKRVTKALAEASTGVEGFWSNALFDPKSVQKHSLTHYAAYAAKKESRGQIFKAPTKVPAVPQGAESSEQLPTSVNAGAKAALKILEKIEKNTSGQQAMVLSLKDHLACGTISPKTVLECTIRKAGGTKGRLAHEMVWRSYMCMVVNNTKTAVKQTN